MNGPERMPPRGRRNAAFAMLVLLGATLGAAVTLAQSTVPPRPRPAGPSNGARSYVPADSGPSAEALKVLNTIPEPLSPAQRVAAPVANDSTKRPPADSSKAGSDSTAAVDDSASAPPPVPAPTQPLGDTTRSVPGYEGAAAGTAGAGAAAAGTAGAAGGAAGPAAPSASAIPDTCWGVQLASPTEKARAESLRDAAQSLLLARMTIEPSKGRFGVRTVDCFTGAAADSLRKRALATGFKDAFRVKWVRAGSGK